MKAIITSITVFALFLSGYGQNEVYQQKMGEALTNYSTAKSITDFQTSAAEFDRISMVAADEWLPYYYYAQCYIMMSFVDKQADEMKKDAYLDVSRHALDKMIALVPNESEVFALEALHNTAKLIINPMTRGQEYGILTQTSIQKALALEPTNPRAKQLDLSNKIGTAQFFGQETAPFCEKASLLLTEWDSYKIKSALHPTWGKDQLISIINNCGKNSNESINTPNKDIEETYTLTININKLKSNNGTVLLELLNEKEEIIGQSSGQVNKTTAILTLKDIKQGTYAIRFFHDENNNMKMDNSKRGIPLESYGFSNNARGFMGPPKFKKLLFEINQNLTLDLKAK